MKIVQSWILNKRSGDARTAGALPGGNDANRIIYNVGYVAQKHINMCGEACVKMLKDYKGYPSGINMDVNPRGAFQGKKFDALANQHNLQEGFFPGQLNAKGTKWTRGAISAQSIKDALTEHGPIICSGDFCRMMGQRFGHYVLVTGVDGDLVHFNDPWHGDKRKKSVDWFVEKLGAQYIEKEKKWADNRAEWGQFPGYSYLYIT
jgi:Papain-like cysteine protease AvrRpt2